MKGLERFVERKVMLEANRKMGLPQQMTALKERSQTNLSSRQNSLHSYVGLLQSTNMPGWRLEQSVTSRHAI